MKFKTTQSPSEPVLSSQALNNWTPTLVGTEDDDDRTISILDTIGEGFFTEGVTSKRIAAALRLIGPGPVTANINSPGGSMFEGVAIYNLLRNHNGNVKINVMGFAGSAASAIAMAGDEIVMNTGSQMMIHNPAAFVFGDYRTMDGALMDLVKFRDSAAEIYEHRTGLSNREITRMMDDETFMTSEEAVRLGFATSTTNMAVSEEPNARMAANAQRRKEMNILNIALAKEGISRKERSEILKNLGLVAPVTDAPNAVVPVTDSTSTAELLRAASELCNSIKKV